MLLCEPQWGARAAKVANSKRSASLYQSVITLAGAFLVHRYARLRRELVSPPLAAFGVCAYDGRFQAHRKEWPQRSAEVRPIGQSTAGARLRTLHGKGS
jgi:hypothetical protein